jgi:hypothetical protein
MKRLVSTIAGDVATVALGAVLALLVVFVVSCGDVEVNSSDAPPDTIVDNAGRVGEDIGDD